MTLWGEMKTIIGITDLRRNFSKFVDRAAAGEEIVIAKAGKPKAKLVPYQPPRKKRVFGQNLLGITYMADDWDGPLPPEIQKYFDGEGDDPSET
jgi:prevent-host-death family protein